MDATCCGLFANSYCRTAVILAIHKKAGGNGEFYGLHSDSQHLVFYHLTGCGQVRIHPTVAIAVLGSGLTSFGIQVLQTTPVLGCGSRDNHQSLVEDHGPGDCNGSGLDALEERLRRKQHLTMEFWILPGGLGPTYTRIK
jgi:hypothetical protein